MTSKIKSGKKERFEYYVMSVIVLLLFFGTIVLAGGMTGTDWASYFPNFSWGGLWK